MDACRSLMTAYTAPQSSDLHTGSMSSVPGCVSRFNVGWALPADPGRWAEPITSATNILTWLADGGLAFACASGLWSGVDKPEAQAKVFLFAPEARLGLQEQPSCAYLSCRGNTQEKGVLGRPADPELVHELSSQTATSRAPPARIGILHRKTLRHQKWHRLCAIVRPIKPF